MGAGEPAHIGVFVASRAEQLAAISQWIRAQGARGRRCIHVAEDVEDPALHAATGGSATILRPEDTYLRNATFVPAETLAWIREQAIAARRDGFTGLACSGEMVCTAHLPDLAGYEAMLNDFLAETPVSAMCIYDHTRIAPAVMRDAFATHPVLRVGEALCHNPRYVPDLGDETARFLAHLRRDRAWALATLDRVEQGRSALARSLHDDLGQQLAALALRADVGDELDDALAAVRALVHGLPLVLDDLGFAPAVRSLVRGETRGTDLALTLDVPAQADLDRTTAVACLRITEAAVRNAVRHARAKTLAVVVDVQPEHVELSVRDDGIGFDPASQHGFGLLDMAQRALLLGGRVEVVTAPGEGTTVRAWVPR